MTAPRRPWWRRWWGITLIVLVIYLPWRFTIAPEPFAAPQSSNGASVDPWTVRLSGPRGDTWYGGCTAITASTASSPAATVSLPWVAHYSEAVQQLQCSFNNDSANEAPVVLQIRYQGHPVAQTRAFGAAGQVSLSATQP